MNARSETAEDQGRKGVVGSGNGRRPSMKGAPQPNDCLDAADFCLPPGQAKITKNVRQKARRSRERCIFLWVSVPFGYSITIPEITIANANSGKFHNYANHHTQRN